MKGFAGFLRHNLDAVTAGLALPWSSGVVEGHVNRVENAQASDVWPCLVRTPADPHPHSAMSGRKLPASCLRVA